jgi:hypothetical protein
MLRRIAASDYATIDLIVFNRAAKPTVPNTATPQPATLVHERSVRESVKGVFERLEQYPWLEPWTRIIRRSVAKARRFAGNRREPEPQNLWADLMNEPAPEPDAFKPIDASDLLRGIPAIEVSPRLTQFSDRFDADNIATIKAYDLDILIRLGFRILRGEILNAARFGVWSYHHGDNYVNRGESAGVWEVLEGAPCTGSVLQILNEDISNGVVLGRSWSATVPFSIVANRNDLYWKTASLLPRKLEELHRFGEQVFFDRVKEENRHLHFYSHRLYTAPTQSELNILLPRLRQRSEEFTRQQKSSLEQWILLYELKEAAPSTSLWRYKRIVPPQDRYWADPFPILQAGRYWIFIEEYLFDTGKGHISVIAMDRDGKYETPRRVLERPYHLSYPCIFSYEGVWYMIPETKRNRTVELYECVSFPDQWKLRRVLIEGVEAVDATVFAHHDRWWMFANIAEYNGTTSTWDELFVFHADDPVEGTWKRHPRNPVVSDVRRARPAGRLFTHEGVIYRPGQDCSRCYGYGIRLHELLRLTEEDYQEKEVCVIEPRWAPDLLGVHTLNFEQGLSIADALIRRPRALAEPSP